MACGNAQYCTVVQCCVVAWFLLLCLLLPRLPLILCVLSEHREAGCELGHLPAVVNGVDAPLLVGNELGRLSAVADGDDVLLLVGSDLGRLPAVAEGDDVLLPVGGELGHLSAVADGEDDVPLAAEVDDGETSCETSWLDSD